MRGARRQRFELPLPTTHRPMQPARQRAFQHQFQLNRQGNPGLLQHREAQQNWCCWHRVPIAMPRRGQQKCWRRFARCHTSFVRHQGLLLQKCEPGRLLQVAVQVRLRCAHRLQQRCANGQCLRLVRALARSVHQLFQLLGALLQVLLCDRHQRRHLHLLLHTN